MRRTSAPASPKIEGGVPGGCGHEREMSLGAPRRRGVTTEACSDGAAQSRDARRHEFLREEAQINSGERGAACPSGLLSHRSY